MAAERVKVNTNCVADTYSSPGERIVEFSDRKGNGGLISFYTDPNGILSVYLYRCGPKVEVKIGPMDQTK